MNPTPQMRGAVVTQGTPEGARRARRYALAAGRLCGGILSDWTTDADLLSHLVPDLLLGIGQLGLAESSAPAPPAALLQPVLACWPM